MRNKKLVESSIELLENLNKFENADELLKKINSFYNFFIKSFDKNSKILKNNYKNQDKFIGQSVDKRNQIKDLEESSQSKLNEEFNMKYKAVISNLKKDIIKLEKNNSLIVQKNTNDFLKRDAELKEKISSSIANHSKNKENVSKKLIKTKSEYSSKVKLNEENFILELKKVDEKFGRNFQEIEDEIEQFNSNSSLESKKLSKNLNKFKIFNDEEFNDLKKNYAKGLKNLNLQINKLNKKLSFAKEKIQKHYSNIKGKLDENKDVFDQTQKENIFNAQSLHKKNVQKIKDNIKKIKKDFSSEKEVLYSKTHEKISYLNAKLSSFKETIKDKKIVLMKESQKNDLKNKLEVIAKNNKKINDLDNQLKNYVIDTKKTIKDVKRENIKNIYDLEKSFHNELNRLFYDINIENLKKEFNIRNASLKRNNSLKMLEHEKSEIDLEMNKTLMELQINMAYEMNKYEKQLTLLSEKQELDLNLLSLKANLDKMKVDNELEIFELTNQINQNDLKLKLNLSKNKERNEKEKLNFIKSRNLELHSIKRDLKLNEQNNRLELSRLVLEQIKYTNDYESKKLSFENDSRNSLADNQKNTNIKKINNKTSFEISKLTVEILKKKYSSLNNYLSNENSLKSEVVEKIFNSQIEFIISLREIFYNDSLILNNLNNFVKDIYSSPMPIEFYKNYFTLYKTFLLTIHKFYKTNALKNSNIIDNSFIQNTLINIDDLKEINLYQINKLYDLNNDILTTDKNYYTDTLYDLEIKLKNPKIKKNELSLLEKEYQNNKNILTNLEKKHSDLLEKKTSDQNICSDKYRRIKDKFSQELKKLKEAFSNDLNKLYSFTNDMLKHINSIDTSIYFTENSLSDFIDPMKVMHQQLLKMFNKDRTFYVDELSKIMKRLLYIINEDEKKRQTNTTNYFIYLDKLLDSRNIETENLNTKIDKNYKKTILTIENLMKNELSILKNKYLETELDNAKKITSFEELIVKDKAKTTTSVEYFNLNTNEITKKNKNQFIYSENKIKYDNNTQNNEIKQKISNLNNLLDVEVESYEKNIDKQLKSFNNKLNKIREILVTEKTKYYDDLKKQPILFQKNKLMFNKKTENLNNIIKKDKIKLENIYIIEERKILNKYISHNQKTLRALSRAFKFKSRFI